MSKLKAKPMTRRFHTLSQENQEIAPAAARRYEVAVFAAVAFTVNDCITQRLRRFGHHLFAMMFRPTQCLRRQHFTRRAGQDLPPPAHRGRALTAHVGRVAP